MMHYRITLQRGASIRQLEGSDATRHVIHQAEDLISDGYKLVNMRGSRMGHEVVQQAA